MASCSTTVWRWREVERSPESRLHNIPCSRSLHVTAIHEDCLYVFGGYDGSSRLNDFFEFSFESKEWRVIPPTGQVPSPRDRHVAVIHNRSFVVFGGFDGVSRINDFFSYSFERKQWDPIPVVGGHRPSARHSHAAVVHNESMYVFGGYDGAYRADFHCFDFARHRWSTVVVSGMCPRARYRSTCVVKDHNMYLFGGHDGTRHLNDVYIFHFEEKVWGLLQTEGPHPIPRDSHVAVVHGPSMYIFGGSTGSAMNDFHALNLKTYKWTPVQASGPPPGHRFCHAAAVHGDAMYVFGGYNGASRLNDFIEFHFGFDDLSCTIPPSTLHLYMKSLVNCEEGSDVTFIVEDKPVYAHKIMCIRCPFFKAMLTGEMMEARAEQIVMPDIKHGSFVQLLEYLYTDHTDVDVESAMELFQAADRFGIDRLKLICESTMLSSINIENAASMLHAADLHHARSLREKCLNYILANFDDASKTASFEEMGRTNVDLLFEILRRR